MKKFLVLLVTFAFGAAIAATQGSEESLAERLKPAGNVCIQGQECATAKVAASSAAADGPRSGEDVYSASCAACHATGLLSSPRFGNADDWAPREVQGLETLYSHALNGLNNMPAKGGNTALSDDEVKAAVDHMLASTR
ncbi:c-type cytochrome [Reinekea marinisedimentorum]|uniref:Cytochrome c5 n=1 Tax=Reinekea marinisedimentorum TaxID=230495 RepID=A0A4R3ID02_9GAMM|nr:c-type cytochrome [Reinekea marinisedimentorum]TCS44075.1 cytochrome c5 [Reinekea marinisedimentorum]